MSESNTIGPEVAAEILQENCQLKSQLALLEQKLAEAVALLKTIRCTCDTDSEMYSKITSIFKKIGEL